MRVEILKILKAYCKVIYYRLLVLTYLVLFLRSFLWLLISLLIGCSYCWSLQPKILHSKGCGNILIPAAAEFAGIGYFEMESFANILNLQFLKKSVYYKHKGEFHLSRNKQGMVEKSRGAV